MLKEIEANIAEINQEIAFLQTKELTTLQTLRLEQLTKNRQELLLSYNEYTAQEKVLLARHVQRPTVKDFIAALFTDFFEMRGDRLQGEDSSILGGVALYGALPVTVIGHQKGRSVEENMNYRFGMPNPEGYRKSLRLMKQAEKFGRPIITFIDTPGAYPGIEAEARGQSEAIARNLAEMSLLKVPVIAIVTGEGGSGGALALGVANKVYMLEHAVYSILSPEGFATILWNDASKSDEASELMKLTAQNLAEFEIIDGIIEEPAGGAHHDAEATFLAVDKVLKSVIPELSKQSAEVLTNTRYEKFRKIGRIEEV